MEIGSIKINSAIANEGDWVGDIPEFGDVRLKVRGGNYPAFRNGLAKAMRAVPKEGRDGAGNILPSYAGPVLGQCMAEFILLGWENITDNGEPVPYSKDMATKWLTDPDFEAFRTAVYYAAARVGTDRQSSIERSMGN